MSNQSGKLMPNLDQQSTKPLNLTVLQIIDPYIEEILITAAQVSFYGFNIDLNQWEHSTAVPVHSYEPAKYRLLTYFLIVNRKSCGESPRRFRVRLQVPYLLYRNASQDVNGIWFYSSRECEDVANLFTRILNAYAKISPKPKVSSNKSEFEELEAVPTSAVIEGPLEPSFTVSTAYAADDSSVVNFFSTAMNIGHNASNVMNSGQLATVPLSSRVPNVVPAPAPALQIPPLSLSSSSTSPEPFHDTSDLINNSNRIANLLKPSSFFTPPSFSSALLTPLGSSSMPTAALQPSLNLRRSHGTPMLQPFPPPMPPISLTPSSIPSPNYGPLSRDQVRDALLVLVQDNQFIDMFYQALLKVH